MKKWIVLNIVMIILTTIFTFNKIQGCETLFQKWFVSILSGFTLGTSILILLFNIKYLRSE